jgi:deoxyadenosine/deoxycytidine kinase
MNNHIVVIGNLGTGKSTLTRLIAQRTSYLPYWEHPEQRPFQQRFSNDLSRWALANQIDFLVHRAGQELFIKRDAAIAIQDSGLDQDFHVFTRYLFFKGYLDQASYDLCRDTYALLRNVLGPPDLFVRVNAPVSAIVSRRAARARGTDDKINPIEDLPVLEAFLDEWMAHNSVPVIHVESRDDDPAFSTSIDSILRDIQHILAS